MHKIMIGLVDVNAAAGLLELRNGSSRWHKYQLPGPPAPEQTCTCIRTSHQQPDSVTLSPQVLH